MRVLLVSANREEINMRTAPLGLACVATATEKAGHDVLLLDLMAEEDPPAALRNAVIQLSPEVIGVSVRNIDDQRMRDARFLLEQAREVVAQCREISRSPVVLGGAGYSIFPDTALAYLQADMGIQGEGERAFPELLQRMERGEDLSGCPGLVLPGRVARGRRQFAEELDAFLLPDKRFLLSSVLERGDFWLPVQTRRGCPMGCSYCSTPIIEGCRIRKRSPETVARWIASWLDAGYRRFFFVDNTFNLPPSYAKGLCSHLTDKAPGASWRAILYPGRMQGGLVREMARAGCCEVSLGFESGSDTLLRRMGKRFTTQDVRLACRMLGDHGIRRTGFLLLGGPGETRNTVEESLAFADSLQLEFVKITLGLRVYPRTPLSREAVEQGLIRSPDELLVPRFYMARGLESWSIETVARWMAERPHWVI
jgi:radical SAM superfamily enzyme YgiQ (UPF0313 family)